MILDALPIHDNVYFLPQIKICHHIFDVSFVWLALENSPFMLSSSPIFHDTFLIAMHVFSWLISVVKTLQNENITVLYILKNPILESNMRVSPLVTTSNNVQRRMPLDCVPASRVIRKLVCMLKSSWKHAMRWHRSNPQYSYDLRSYYLNFSDSSSNDLKHCTGWWSFLFNCLFCLSWISCIEVLSFCFLHFIISQCYYLWLNVSVKLTLYVYETLVEIMWFSNLAISLFLWRACKFESWTTMELRHFIIWNKTFKLILLAKCVYLLSQNCDLWNKIIYKTHKSFDVVPLQLILCNCSSLRLIS